MHVLNVWFMVSAVIPDCYIMMICCVIIHRLISDSLGLCIYACIIYIVLFLLLLDAVYTFMCMVLYVHAKYLTGTLQ